MTWRAAAMAALLGAASLQACDGEIRTEFKDAPFDGQAFPNVRPKIAWPQGWYGLTSDNGSDTLTALDLTNRKVLAKVPIGRDPVGNDGPHHLAIDLQNRFVYVALSYPAPAIAPGPHAGHGSSVRAGRLQKLDLDDLRVLGDVAVQANPGDIVLSQDGKRLVLAHFDLQRALSGTTLQERRAPVTIVAAAAVLPAQAPEPVLVPACILPHGLALSPGAGDTAWVACYGEDAVAIVDVAHPQQPVVLVPVGPAPGPPGGAPVYGPYSAVASADGSLVALGQIESHDIRLLNTSDRLMSPLVLKTGGAAYFPQFSHDGKRLYVPTQAPDGLLVFDLDKPLPVASRSFDAGLCRRPHEVQVQTNAENTADLALFVVCEGRHGESDKQTGAALPDLPGAVLVLDPLTLATLATLPVGVYPDRLALARWP